MNLSRRGPWVLVLLVLAGLCGAVTLPTWITATATGPVVGTVGVRVAGSAAAPGVIGASLVLAAAALALGLVGRVGRWVVSVVIAAGGVVVLVGALTARAGAQDRAEQAAADLTGVGVLDGDISVAPWPWAAAGLGVLVIVAAVLLLRVSAHWAAPSARHERAGAPSTAAGTEPPADDERATWDALGRGDDPT
ncbi:Trp biosynthesis-associated membrane protein [Cellulomonas sp. NPDC089187]|uniref:Trp biosynthesis-associated membrane protein n=1 Tax=Cellulomonas sp. NPDC089187 TaxID=3154970 RepID=UPI00341B26F5